MTHSDIDQTDPEISIDTNIASFTAKVKEKALTEQLIVQKRLLLEKQSQFEQLQQDHDNIIKHLRIIEAEWENSNAMLEQLMSQMTKLKQQPNPQFQTELAQLKQQLEEATTSKSVMKHHCRELNERNQELNRILKESLENSDSLATKAAQQAEQINLYRNENVQLKQQNIIQKEELKRLQSQLDQALHGYYTGVINKNKRVSTNLPK